MFARARCYPSFDSPRGDEEQHCLGAFMAGRIHFVGSSGRGAVEVDCALVRFNLLGQSPAFAAAMQLVRRFAPCPATVLVHGETGTGKELSTALAIFRIRR